jgi:hypothetical protein
VCLVSGAQSIAHLLQLRPMTFADRSDLFSLICRQVELRECAAAESAAESATVTVRSLCRESADRHRGRQCSDSRRYSQITYSTNHGFLLIERFTMFIPSDANAMAGICQACEKSVAPIRTAAHRWD